MKKGVFLLVLMIAVTSLGAAQQSANTVTAIEIRGNSLISNEDIAAVIKLKTGTELDSDVLLKDRQAIYSMGWFYDVRIEYEPYNEGLKVIYEVVENFVVGDLKLSGVESLPQKDIENLINIEKGRILNTARLSESLHKIIEKYNDEGFVIARVRQAFMDDDGTLNIEISEGTLAGVFVDGYKKTKDHVVWREIRLKEGEVFNVVEIQKALQRLYALGYFTENINTNLEMADSEKNTANVFINLEEKDSGEFLFGGGYSTKDGWMGSLEIGDKNFLGNGQNVSLKWEFGSNQVYELGFQEPYLFGKKYSFGVNLFQHVTNDKETEKNSEGEKEEYRFREINQGTNINFGVPFTNTLSLGTRLRLDKRRINWKDGNPPSDREDFSGRTRSITFTGVKNTTVEIFNPRKGLKDSASIEFAGYLLGGDYNFSKYGLDLRRYYPGFKDEQSWALRLKGGIALGSEGLPSHELYRLGGDTIRAYDYGTFKGDRMLLLNAEYRFKIYSIFDGAIFFDVGNAWDRSQTGSLKMRDFKAAIGAGIRMNTPLGQLRLDLGYGENGLKPHFGIGETF